MLIANVSQDAGGWDSPHLTQTTRTRDIWSGHVAWAPASAGAAAGTPGGESPFPPPPAPGAQSQVEVFLPPSVAWAGHPTWSSLILGNEPYPLRMAPRSPVSGGGRGICHTGGGFLWLWQNCTWESAEGQYCMDKWFTDSSFTSQKLLQHVYFDMGIFYADAFQLRL